MTVDYCNIIWPFFPYTVVVNGFCKYSYFEILLALKFCDIIILMFLKAKTVSHF